MLNSSRNLSGSTNLTFQRHNVRSIPLQAAMVLRHPTLHPGVGQMVPTRFNSHSQAKIESNTRPEQELQSTLFLNCTALRLSMRPMATFADWNLDVSMCQAQQNTCVFGTGIHSGLLLRGHAFNNNFRRTGPNRVSFLEEESMPRVRTFRES